MRKIFLFIIGMAVVTLTAVIACTNTSAKNEKKAAVSDSAQKVKRGEYLVTVGGCDDCHSPKIMGPKGPEIDVKKRFSGFPAPRPIPKFDSNLVKKGIAQFNEDLTSAAGPWGVSFAANITGDMSGIGNWTLENFKYALRHGKWKGPEGSRDLLPPMPWFNMAKMTDEDLEAIYVFLEATKPVENIVPAPKLFNEL